MGEITQESKELRDFVRAGEGFIPFIHLDQLGYPTVGIGHLLREKTVRKPEYDLYPHGNADYADVLKVHHYVRKRDGVRTHPFYKTKEVIASDEEVKEDFDEVIRAGVKFVRAGVACLTGPQLATQLQDSGVPAFQPLHVPGFSPPLLDVLGRGLIGPPALQKRVHLRVLPRSRSKKEKRQLTPFEAFYREKHD